MWTFTVIALALVVGSFGISDECMTPERMSRCDHLMDYGSAKPGDVEGLYILCQKFQRAERCLTDVYKNCSNDQHYIDYLESSLEYIEQECNPDSNILQIVSNNLQCLQSPTSTEGACISSHEHTFMEARRQDLVEDYVTEECVDRILKTVCDAVAVTKNCGEDAGTAYLDIILNMHYGLRFCPTAVTDTISDIVTDLLLWRSAEK